MLPNNPRLLPYFDHHQTYSLDFCPLIPAQVRVRIPSLTSVQIFVAASEYITFENTTFRDVRDLPCEHHEILGVPGSMLPFIFRLVW